MHPEIKQTRLTSSIPRMAEQQPMDTTPTPYLQAVMNAEYGAPGVENLPKLLMPSPIKLGLRNGISVASESLRVVPGAGTSLRVKQARCIDTEGYLHE